MKCCGVMAKALKNILLICFVVSLAGCGGHSTVYHDKNMDFGAIHAVAVLPFVTLQGGSNSAEMLRDDLMNSLMATGAFYVVPSGEVAHGIAISGMQNPAQPTVDDVKKFCSLEKVNAVITGVVKEFGSIGSGATSSNEISVNLQMIEGQTGRVVWSADTTLGGVTIFDRLFGGGAQPMDNISQKAVNDLIKKLFM